MKINNRQLKYLFVIYFQINSLVAITNVDCEMHDKKFGSFEYCFIKSINRTYKYLSLKVLLYERPVSNVTAGFAILKRANGYKPFLYNVSFDGCKFMKGSRNNLIHSFFYSLFADYSNINHSCPYDVSSEKFVRCINNYFLFV